MSTAPFPGLASESTAISWAESTRFWGGEGVDGVPVWPAAAEVAEGVVRGRMVAHWEGGRGGRAHPSQCPAWKVRGLRFVGGGEQMVMVGRKGRQTSPSKPIRGIEWSHSLRGR